MKLLYLNYKHWLVKVITFKASVTLASAADQDSRQILTAISYAINAKTIGRITTLIAGATTNYEGEELKYSPASIFNYQMYV